MQNYNQQQQAVILKGIAQQILSMNVPSFKVVMNTFLQFDLHLVEHQRMQELLQNENKIEEMYSEAYLMNYTNSLLMSLGQESRDADQITQIITSVQNEMHGYLVEK